MATLSANESPAPSRRSRHSKSQSTSALSTILDIPRQRGSIPPVPALPSDIPSSSRRQPYESYRSSRDARLPTLPGLTDSSDLSDGGSSTTNSYDSPSTSRRSTHTSSVTRSRTYQNLEDPGSPTPKRSRARAMDDLKTRGDGPLATPQASPSKKRSHKDRTDGLTELGVQRRPSRRRGEAGSPRKDGHSSRAVSKEGGLKAELAECAAIVSVIINNLSPVILVLITYSTCWVDRITPHIPSNPPTNARDATKTTGKLGTLPPAFDGKDDGSWVGRKERAGGVHRLE